MRVESLLAQPAAAIARLRECDSDPWREIHRFMGNLQEISPGRCLESTDPAGVAGPYRRETLPKSKENTVSNPNVETVQRIYAAFGRGDVEAILAELTDDVDWSSEASSTEAPWWGAHHGKAEVPRFFQALASTIEVTEFTPLAFASNDTDVFAVIRFASKVTATGKSGAMDLHHRWEFRGGKVCRYRGTEDTILTASLLAP